MVDRYVHDGAYPGKGQFDAKSLGATVPATVDSFGVAGYNQQNNRVAAAAPSNCATINPGASTGRIPANVLDAARAKVTAGLANEVDEVNQ